MSNTKSSANKTILIVIIILTIIISTIFFIPTNTIEGISIIDRDFQRIDNSNMSYLISPYPDKNAPVYIVSNTFSDDNRLQAIKDYYRARLKYDIAVNEKKLGRRKQVDMNLKLNRDRLDSISIQAIQSIISDPGTITLRTDAEGRFAKNVPSGKYFIFIRSNRNIYLTMSEVNGEFSYKDDINLYAFQTYHYEQTWTPSGIK